MLIFSLRSTAVYFMPFMECFDSTKRTLGFDVKLSVSYPASIRRLLVKFLKDLLIFLFRKLHFGWAGLAILAIKGEHLKAARMYSFEIKRKRKTPEDISWAKFNALSIKYLNFLHFLFYYRFFSENKNLDSTKFYLYPEYQKKCYKSIYLPGTSE